MKTLQPLVPRSKDTFTLDEIDQHNKVYIFDNDILIKRIQLELHSSVWVPIFLRNGHDSSYSYLSGKTAAECISRLLVHFVKYYPNMTAPTVKEFTPHEYHQWLSVRWSK